jgi:hypothetical protein
MAGEETAVAPGCLIGGEAATDVGVGVEAARARFDEIEVRHAKSFFALASVGGDEVRIGR